MKRIIAVLISFTLFSVAHAKNLVVNSGNWIFDKQRLLVLDEFDYVYFLSSINPEARLLELEDGSLWKVEEEMGLETQSFYSENKDIPYSNIEEWQIDDQLIFHKVFNKNTLLIYNMTRDQLVDVLLYSSSTKQNLFISKIDFGSHLLTLSDQSIWYFEHYCACKKWKVGEPICVAKDTPWLSQNTHILINLRSRDNNNTKEASNRLGVRHAN